MLQVCRLRDRPRKTTVSHLLDVSLFEESRRKSRDGGKRVGGRVRMEETSRKKGENGGNRVGGRGRMRDRVGGRVRMEEQSQKEGEEGG